MSLLKRGNVWWSYFYIDGVRQQASTGTANRRQAEQVEQRFKAEANARRHQVVQYDPNMTVAALAARFVADADLKPHHVYQLKALLPFFGDVKVSRLNRNMAHEFRRWRHQQKTVTDATVNRALSVLRHILYWAVDESILHANPLARVPLVRERRLRRPVMSVSEESALLPVLPDYLRRIVIAALDTGMRRKEILRQRWEDIDSDRRVLLASVSKTPMGESREIPLTSRMVELLNEDWQREGFVFTRNGLPLSWIRKGWLGALKRAGLRHFRFHDLRHTHATRLLLSGTLADVRMSLLGHSFGGTVHSTYIHVELPEKREAIRKLEQWVKEQQQTAKEKSDGNAQTDRRESATSADGAEA